MIPQKMMEVLEHEGVIAIATQGSDGAHLVNTWNSYLKVTQDESLLAPVGGMTTTEANIRQNNKVLVTMGSREVQGLHSMGTGFLVTASAEFVSEGSEFAEMKEKFPWARAVLKIKPESIKQTL